MDGGESPISHLQKGKPRLEKTFGKPLPIPDLGDCICAMGLGYKGPSVARVEGILPIPGREGTTSEVKWEESP